MAMVGIRAPAAEQPRRSDSHHSPRHDLSVPGIGKQGVNVATGVSDVAARILSVAPVEVSDVAAGILKVPTGISDVAAGISNGRRPEISEVEEYEASSANVAADFNPTTVSPWSGAGSTRPSTWPAERPAPDETITPRIHGSGSMKPGYDQQGGAREK